MLVGGWVGKWCPPTLSSLEKGACTRYCSESPQRKVNNLSSPLMFQASIRSLPPPSLCPWLSAFLVPQLPCVLSLAYSWDSKLQIFKETGRAWTTPLLQRRVFPMCLVPFNPRKAVPWPCRCLEFMVKHSKKQWPVICPLHAPLSLANEWPLNGAHWVFCPLRGNIPSSKCTLGRGTFSPSVTQGTPIPCYLFPGLCPPFPLQHCHSGPAQLQWMPWTSNTSEFELCYLQKCDSQFFGTP